MNPPSKVFRFEKLDVWQKARLLNKDINEVTKRFPSSELYALTSQIRRASISVSSNIAEGAGRNSDADFARFLEIACGSLMEVVSQLYLALDEKYLTQELWSEILEKADILAAQIAALSKSLGRTPRSLKQ